MVIFLILVLKFDESGSDYCTFYLGVLGFGNRFKLTGIAVKSIFIWLDIFSAFDCKAEIANGSFFKATTIIFP